jgi:pSer/pThr/pTyr-binding forkhead associated (FHA) protein
MTIGRDSRANDVVLLDSLISSAHLRIHEEAGLLVLVDLGSTNGTFIRGERVQRHILRSGDLIALGDTLLRYAAER